MGDSNLRSNMVGTGVETITEIATIEAATLTGSGTVSGDNVTAVDTVSGVTLTASGTVNCDDLTAVDVVSGATVQATNYLRVGTEKYIFISDYVTEASIVAAATAINATNIGSITLGAGSLWVHDSNTTASTVTLV